MEALSVSNIIVLCLGAYQSDADTSTSKTVVRSLRRYEAYRGLIGFVCPNSTSTLPLLQTLVLCFSILIPEKASAERNKNIMLDLFLDILLENNKSTPTKWKLAD